MSKVSKIIVGNKSVYVCEGCAFSGALPGEQSRLQPLGPNSSIIIDIAEGLPGIKPGDAVSPRISMGGKRESGQPLIYDPKGPQVLYFVEGLPLDFHVVLQ